MTIKEYWAIFRQKKSVLAELDRDIKNKQNDLDILMSKFKHSEELQKLELLYQKSEAKLKIREENFEVISRLEHNIKWLEDTLNLERVHSRVFISILNNTFNTMQDKIKEIQES